MCMLPHAFHSRQDCCGSTTLADRLNNITGLKLLVIFFFFSAFSGDNLIQIHFTCDEPILWI